jgi:predicted transcriptional regulator YdeE
MNKDSKPRIVRRGAFQVVGLPLFGNPRESAFSAAWDIFGQIADETSWLRRKGKLYGLQIYPPRYPHPFEFIYLAGVEVPADTETPLRCVRKELPPARYAVFEVRGGPKGIDGVYRYAYRDWLPASGYMQAFPYDFEEYDRPTNPETDPLRIRIWIPIKKKN